MKLFVSALLLLSSCFAPAAEENLDLGTMSEKSQLTAAPQPKWNLMGRMDLTSETSAPDKGKESQHELTNRHFLVFLHVKASPKTSFFGEIVAKDLYFVSYQALNNLNIQFGKVLVPFGDTRKYHHIYGGLSQLKATSLMFPNIWAENGINLSFKTAESETIDLYWVNSIQASSETADPDLKSSSDPRNQQAAGTRWTRSFGQWTSLLSVYRGEYLPGREVFIAGGDLYSEYGAFGLSRFRWALGIANAWIKRSPVTGNFEKRGDYLEIAYSKAFQSEDELRIRYGTYIDNTEKQSQKDTHSFSLAYLFPVDVMKVLVEYQWNFEEVSEKNNDIAKAMLSLDF